MREFEQLKLKMQAEEALKSPLLTQPRSTKFTGGGKHPDNDDKNEETKEVL
jgi:hypothetical protein